MAYNPNSIWGSKKYAVEPKKKATGPAAADEKKEPAAVTEKAAAGKTPAAKSAIDKPVAEKPTTEKTASAKTSGTYTAAADPKTASGKNSTAAAKPKNDFWNPAPQEEEGTEKFQSRFGDGREFRTWSLGPIIFGIFLIAVLSATLYFFLRPSNNPNVAITFSDPGQVLAGDPFTLAVSFANNSQSDIPDASLSIILPQDVSFVGNASGQSVVQVPLGDVAAGSINKQTFTLVTSGDPNSIEHLEAKLIYGTSQNSPSQFEADGTEDLTVGSPAFNVTIQASQNVFSGQDFTAVVNYNNNSAHDLSGVVLEMLYPSAFQFVKSSVQPSSPGGNSWNLGTVPAGANGSFTVTGNLTGPSGASYPIGVKATDLVSGVTYPLTSQTANLSIANSPLSLAITAGGSANYIAGLTNNVDYVITFTNNSNVTYQNMKVVANLTGAMFSFPSLLVPNGSFNSLSNTLTWYGASNPQLTSLAPGQSGSVTFSVETKNTFPINLVSDKDYALLVNARITSPTVPPNTAASSTATAASLTTKLGGVINLAATGYYADAGTAIKNSGPYPPKVNKATDYTIHWDITNYATDADNVTVSSYLAPGTTCTGKFTAPASTTVMCNTSSGEISWSIPVIAATTGVLGKPLEAVFQVQATPAVNQVGRDLTLVGTTKLTATDAFTGAALTSQADEIQTDLPNDTSVPNGNREVSQ